MAHASPSKLPKAENDILPIRDKIQLLCYFLSDPYASEGARAEKLIKTMEEVLDVLNKFSRLLKAAERRNAVLLSEFNSLKQKYANLLSQQNAQHPTDIPDADLLEVDMEDNLGETPEEAPGETSGASSGVSP
ncbi:uncharacterized protein V6R79_017902 [Siganus canaliculatus]